MSSLLMFDQFWTISRNTFTEAIRQPIYVVLMGLGTALIGFTPAFAAYTLEHGRGDNKMSIDLSLGTIFLAGVALAAFTATGVLSREIENRTVLTVVSKPVTRPLFVLGKFTGVLAAIAVAHYVLCLAFILTIRHGVMQTASDHFDQPVWTFGSIAVLGSLLLATWGNYYLGWVFTSTLVKALAILGSLATALVLVISHDWAFQSPLTEFTKNDGELTLICGGLLLLLEAVTILTAVAIACSTRMGQVMTLVVCLGVYLLGIISSSFSLLVNRQLGIQPQTGYIDSLAAIASADVAAPTKVLYFASKVLYLLAPNLQYLWPADAITQGNPFGVGYLLSVSAYAAFYTAVVLCVAVALFQSREVG